MNNHKIGGCCQCGDSSSPFHIAHSRRSFIRNGASFAAALGAANASPLQALGADQTPPAWFLSDWNPGERFLTWGKPLRIQPILMYASPQPREMTSWRSWGGVLSDASAAEEVERIAKELQVLKSKAEFPIELAPVQKAKTPEETAAILMGEFDAVLLYPASGSGRLLQACVAPDRDALIFVRHRSGPVYYWYEALSAVYLQTDKEQPNQEPPRLGKTHVDDVVVDDYDDVLWRLRALYGVKNLKNSAIVALGGVWGKYAADAPEIARKQWGMNIIEIGYSAIEPRIRQALADNARMAKAEKQASQYLAMSGVSLETGKSFVVNAFVLYELFKELMLENNAPAFTIKECMSTIIPMAKTTACLSLSLLNDEGLLAFCESDFVVIPAGVLMRHIVNAPVFLHNSTFPHKGVVTCAHCSAPRRMNGDRYEPVRILTHEESDYGAAPKVEIPIGQQVTFIDPEYTKGRWVGMRGNVEDNPFLPICRSQQDVRIQGNWKKLLNEVRDSHWLMAYGDCLNEIGYAARKLGVRWDNITDEA
ncbi:MAG: sugar isomerase [Candidatus Omnitrophota bacterium]